MPHTVVIIGAGFSGAAVAIQLLRRAQQPLRIILVNKSGRMARGLAYGTNSPGHVLNVPAANMSALADVPLDFLEYCRWAAPGAEAHSFMPRALYGAYLAALLSASECRSAAAGTVVLERVIGEAKEIVHDSEKPLVILDGGRRIECDEVVLAFGHFPPADLLSATERALLGARYIPDPWAQHWLRDDGRDGDVLLIGAGLTALDVVTSLHDKGHRGRIICLSRRGLMPRSHRGGAVQKSTVDGATLAQNMGSTLRRQLRVLRETIEVSAATNIDWRDVIVALRPYTPALWHALNSADKRRFMRHLRVWWDAFRHRCAPEVLAVAEELKDAGQLQLIAGRLKAMRRSARNRAEIDIRPRGMDVILTREFDLVINCTGPSNDLRRSGVPLLTNLLRAGYVQPDPLGIGLAVDDDYAVINARGEAQNWLRYIGPMLQARDWEATAVPELRLHALQLAERLLSDYSLRLLQERELHSVAG